MRAIYLQRICPALRRQQIAYYSTPVSAIRQFHCSRLNATASLKENVDSEVPTPRKRGRPKKIKPENTTPEMAEPTTATEAEVEVPRKLAKPRKKAPPKISDITRLIPPNVLQPSPNRSLRPYQEECVEACLKAVEEGKRRLGISLATGAGKTVIFTNLIGKVQLEDSKRYQTLILVHRRELVEQAARHCVEAYPDKTVEIEMSNFHSSGTADITVCSVQSLLRSDRLAKFNPEWAKLILIDEAHHAAAPTYLKILEHFGALTRESKVVVVGVSATLSRLDGLKLGTALDEIVYHRDYIEMIGEKWLSTVKFTTVQTDIDLRQVRNNKFGDFSTSQLSRVVNTTNANEVTVRAWLDRAQERRSTLAFCVDLEHVRDMTNTFRRYGVDARFITSKTQTTDRHTLIQQFRNREFPVLVNCGIFVEGTDIPNIDCILLARPTRSRNLMVQMIGRGMRLSPGKQDCHVIDMVGSVKTHGVVTTPTLFGLDPNEIVSEETADGLRQRAEEWKKIRELEKEEMIRNDPMLSSIAQSITYTDWDSVQSLLDDVTDLHIRQMSRLAWVYIGEYKHVLSIPRHGFLRVDKALDGTFLCTETREIPSYHFKNADSNKPITVHAPPRVLFDSLNSLAHAIAAADTYATSRFPHSLISRTAMWRNGAATIEQIRFVNKFKADGCKYDLPGEHRTGRSLTKGAAGDFITRVRHGGKAIWEKSKQRGRRVEKEMERLEKVGRAESVRVGAIA